MIEETGMRLRFTVCLAKPQRVQMDELLDRGFIERPSPTSPTVGCGRIA
jgi:hypothetical protein